MDKMNKAQFQAAIEALLQRVNLDEVGVLKQNEKGKFYMVININAGFVDVPFQGENINGRLQGNLFLQNVTTSQFAEQARTDSAKPKAATLSLADLKAKLAARK